MVSSPLYREGNTKGFTNIKYFLFTLFVMATVLIKSEKTLLSVVRSFTSHVDFMASTGDGYEA